MRFCARLNFTYRLIFRFWQILEVYRLFLWKNKKEGNRKMSSLFPIESDSRSLLTSGPHSLWNSQMNISLELSYFCNKISSIC